MLAGCRVELAGLGFFLLTRTYILVMLCGDISGGDWREPSQVQRGGLSKIFVRILSSDLSIALRLGK